MTVSSTRRDCDDCGEPFQPTKLQADNDRTAFCVSCQQSRCEHNDAGTLRHNRTYCTKCGLINP